MLTSTWGRGGRWTWLSHAVPKYTAYHAARVGASNAGCSSACLPALGAGGSGRYGTGLGLGDFGGGLGLGDSVDALGLGNSGGGLGLGLGDAGLGLGAAGGLGLGETGGAGLGLGECGGSTTRCNGLGLGLGLGAGFGLGLGMGLGMGEVGVGSALGDGLCRCALRSLSMSFHSCNRAGPTFVRLVSAACLLATGAAGLGPRLGETAGSAGLVGVGVSED